MDIRQYRRQHILFLAVMPDIEPHWPESFALQIGEQVIHYRTFTAAPLAGNRNRQWRLGIFIGQETRQPQRNLPRTHQIGTPRPGGLIRHTEIGNTRGLPLRLPVLPRAQSERRSIH